MASQQRPPLEHLTTNLEPSDLVAPQGYARRTRAHRVGAFCARRATGVSMTSTSRRQYISCIAFSTYCNASQSFYLTRKARLSDHANVLVVRPVHQVKSELDNAFSLRFLAISAGQVSNMRDRCLTVASSTRSDAGSVRTLPTGRIRILAHLTTRLDGTRWLAGPMEVNAAPWARTTICIFPQSRTRSRSRDTAS